MFFKKTVFFKKSQPVLFLKYPCEIESFVYKQVYYEASLSRRLRSSCAYYTNYILPFINTLQRVLRNLHRRSAEQVNLTISYDHITS